MLVALVFASLLLPWAGVRAIVLEVEEDSKNTVAPADDPGWANVGACRGLTCVYLGGGWVLTARHAGVNDLTLEGKRYTADPKSKQVIPTEDRTRPDLLLFRIEPTPVLPTLALSKSPPEIGSSVVMVGKGHGRGDPVEGVNFSGFFWSKRSKMRWGTGVVVEYLDAVGFGSTKGFATRFSIAKTRHEAQAAPGDSGGAAFARGVDRWELAGIILEIKGNSGGQPPRTAVYGNRTIIANLAHYREAIQQITGLR
jgi:hypothetical protein